MSHIIIEIKAKCADHEPIRQILLEKGADFRGTDHQIDTYFKVPNGRLKLREGNIENTLIHYERENEEGPKQSNVTLYELRSWVSTHFSDF
jgi:adenylate cyclase class 2